MNTTKTPSLKPCPFCGGEAKLRQHFIGFDSRVWGVSCERDSCTLLVETRASDAEYCYRTGPKGKASAIRAWNTRKKPSP